MSYKVYIFKYTLVFSTYSIQQNYFQVDLRFEEDNMSANAYTRLTCIKKHTVLKKYTSPTVIISTEVHTFPNVKT